MGGPTLSITSLHLEKYQSILCTVSKAGVDLDWAVVGSGCREENGFNTEGSLY